jgi:hypothetical protein
LIFVERFTDFVYTLIKPARNAHCIYQHHAASD